MYSIFTRLYLAKHYHGKNDYQKAQSHLSFIIDNDFSKNYKELAKIRLSRVYISQDNYEQALEVINTVDESSSFAESSNITSLICGAEETVESLMKIRSLK